MSDPEPTEITPRPEFSSPVTGDKGSAVRTAEDGSLATDNYPFGGGFDHDGSAYPYTIDTADTQAGTFQELYVTESGNIDMEILTSLGDTFTIPLASTTGSFDGFEVDVVTFKDPNGTNAPLKGGWAGES